MTTEAEKTENEASNRSDVKEPAVSASRDDVVEAAPTNEPGPDVVAQEPTAKEEFVEEVDMPPGEPIEVDFTGDARAAISKNFQRKERNYVAEEAPPVDKGVDNEPPGATIDVDVPEMIDVTVYGRTRKVEKSKVDKAGGIQAYQKELAVMEGFKEVKAGREANARTKDELDRQIRQFNEKQAALPTLDEQQRETDPPSQDDRSFEQLSAAYHEALLEGEEDERDKLYAKLHKVNAGAETQIDVDAMVEKAAVKAAEKIAKRDRLQAEKVATNNLIKLHPELKTDERLFIAVDDEATIVQREQPDWKPDQILTEAYTRIEKWKGKNKEATMNDKQEQKRAMNTPVVSTGRAQAPPPPVTRSDSEYIRQLRVNRGLE